MKKGIIADLLDYYHSESIFKGEIERAVDEFFGRRIYGEMFLRTPERQIIDGLFNEWLVYDFKMMNGKTLLEDFCEFNPVNLPEYELQNYRELLKNKYAMFETLKVRWHQGLEIRDLQTGKEYWVKEKLGTEQAKPGYIFFGRVAKIGDYWELISADSPALPMRLEDGAREHFSKMKGEFSPKEVYAIFYGKNEKEKPERQEEKDPKKAEENLQYALEKTGLGEFVNAKTVRRWIKNEEYDRPEGYINMIFGLLDQKGNYDKKDVDELMVAFSDFHNSIAQKRLGGKSPNEAKRAQKEGEADWHFNVTQVRAGEWTEHLYEAHEYFKKNNPEKSLEHYNKCFEYLIKNKMTEREIYRIFANKATAHFQLGEREEALALLDMALELNPNYDFAQKTLEKYQRGEYENTIKAGLMEQMRKNMSDPDNPLNKWNFDDIKNNWSVEKIVSQLKEFGIEIDQDELRQKAQEYSSVEDFEHKSLFPLYKGKEEDEDFVMMAAYGLWRAWCSDMPTVEYLSENIEKFWDTVLNEEIGAKKKKTEKELEYFEHIAESASCDFFKRWKDAGEYQFDVYNLSESLGRLVGTKLEKKALQLAKIFKEKTGHDYFRLAGVCFAAYHNEDWVEQIHELSEFMPYEYNFCLAVAEIFNRLDNSFLEEECLNMALTIIKNRDRDKTCDLESSRNTIYEDYKNVLERMEEFYEETKNKKGLGKIRGIRREIKSRKEELSKSEKENDMIEKMTEFESEMFQKRFENDPANRYFQFLKKTGINFATKELTKSVITVIGPKVKVGRNDPCPCGSGKKYKKCCL